MTVPNLITIGRFLLVPAVIYAILQDAMVAALLLFLVAGLSDAVDGAIARYFNQSSTLGAWLDPIADKLLLMSVYLVLAYMEHLPQWLVVLVVARDALILCAVGAAYGLKRPLKIAPIFVSKANTAAQIALAVLVLAELAFSLGAGDLRFIMVLVTAGLTVLSAASYFLLWARHMAGRTD